MWELEDTQTHLQLFQLLQDHVVRHVVKQSVCGGQDDVPKLDIEGRAVSSLGAGEGQRLKDSGTHRDTKQPHTAHPQLLHSPVPWGFVQEKEIITHCGALAPGWAVRKALPQPLWLQTGFAVKIPTWAILQTNLLRECVSMETSKQNGSSGLPSAHLEDTREWYLKEQFITGLAQTLQDSESLSNSMEYETCLEIATRRPESVGMLMSNTLHNTKRRKTPSLGTNITAKSDSQKQHNSKPFISKDSSGVCKKEKPLHPRPLSSAKTQRSCFAQLMCSYKKADGVKVACLCPYIAKFITELGQQIKKDRRSVSTRSMSTN